MAALVPLLVKASIVLLAFGLALNAKTEDILFLLRKPGLLLRSVLAMNVIMPLFAVAFVLLLQLHQGLEFALVALAISPIPPFLPKKQIKASGESSYTTSLLVVSGLLSIVFVPLAVALLGVVFDRPSHMPVTAVAMMVFLTVLGPLLVGLVVARLAPALSAAISRPLTLIATALLGVGVILILFGIWPAVLALLGNGTIAGIIVFVLVGLFVGHVLGGPDPNDRSVLALATASRHPGVAIAIAVVNAPGEKTVLAAVLLYLFVGALVSAPYAMWRQRVRLAAAS